MDIKDVKPNFAEKRLKLYIDKISLKTERDKERFGVAYKRT